LSSNLKDFNLHLTSRAEHPLSCASIAEQPPLRAAEQGRTQSRGAAGAGVDRRSEEGRAETARGRGGGNPQQTSAARGQAARGERTSFSRDGGEPARKWR